jgi:hypothetical protein
MKKIDTTNLLLGAAVNLPLDSIRVFIDSFRNVNQEADVFVLVEGTIDDEKLSYLKSRSVSILSFECNDILGTPPNNYRVFKFLDFIRENANYKNILLSDISDVYFQQDPFEESPEEFIFFAEEDDSVKIEENSFNARWIAQCFGVPMLNAIGGNPISCSGTLMGSYENVLVYMNEMSKELKRIKNSDSYVFSDIIDQGIHNFIVYQKMEIFKNPEMKKNGDFYATIGLTLEKSPSSIQKRENMLEVNNMIPRIVHQYNRSEDLINFYKNAIEQN